MTSGRVLIYSKLIGELNQIPNYRYDSSMMNGLQAVNSWNNCELIVHFLRNALISDPLIVYDSPRSTLLGLMSAMYSLGGVIALPFVPYVTDNLGRRRAIILGSILMIIGAVLQTASQNCKLSFQWFIDTI